MQEWEQSCRHPSQRQEKDQAFLAVKRSEHRPWPTRTHTILGSCLEEIGID